MDDANYPWLVLVPHVPDACELIDLDIDQSHVLSDEIDRAAGTETLEHARRYHRDGIQRHFSQHLTNADIKALTRALEKVSTHARPLRPGRIRG